MKAKRPSGEFKELKIENSGAEVIRKNGAFQVVESDVRSNFFLHPEFKNIRFRNGRRILEEEKEFYSDYILRKHFRYNEKDQLLEIEIEDHQTFNLPQEKKESIFYSTLINFVALSYKNTFLGKNLVVLFETEHWKYYKFGNIINSDINNFIYYFYTANMSNKIFSLSS